MTGLNQQHDVEIAELPGDEYDLIPLSDKGVRAIGEHLGVDAEMNASVRVTEDQYRRFHRYAYRFAKDRYKTFSTAMRRRFLGQRQADQSDLSLPSDPVLPAELSSKLSYGGTVHLKDHDFTVSDTRYGDLPTGDLFKVTSRKHSPEHSARLSIGTLAYYRHTVDPTEASFAPSAKGHWNRKSIYSMDGKRLADPRAGSWTSVALNPCWIYCTTSVGPDGLEPDQSSWHGNDMVATPIVSSTSRMALMLGATFGHWSLSRVQEVYAWLESHELLAYTMNGIGVVHGPVRYMSASYRNEYLETLSRDQSPIEVHENVFTKSDEFAWEREYRFAIWGWGPPLQDHIVMPVTRELCDCYGVAVSTASVSATD